MSVEENVRDGGEWMDGRGSIALQWAAGSPAPSGSSVARAQVLSAAGLSEKLLVERMRAGDESAFDAFADAYAPGLYRFVASRMTRDLDDVPDVVQTALCRAIEKLDSFRGEAAIFTWLCACCRNEIAGFYRRSSRRPAEVELDENVVAQASEVDGPADPEAEASLLRAETAAMVHVALDQLPGHYARALEWKYFERLRVDEIARRLELTTKAAESLLSRARKAFQDAYRHLDGRTVDETVAALPGGERAS
jgi:RNA polymerase sigma-70 factor (ECF subfamily)